MPHLPHDWPHARIGESECTRCGCKRRLGGIVWDAHASRRPVSYLPRNGKRWVRVSPPCGRPESLPKAKGD